MKIPFRYLVILIVCLLSSATIQAEVHNPVKVDFEKKVIYVDSLTLPKSINVGALLRLLPELLQRSGDYITSYYEVQVDGVAMGESTDAVLAILQVEDIERLEVSNSPTASDLNGGMSGAINLILRPLANKKKDLSGKVAVGVSTEWSAMGDLLLDYKSDKLNVRGLAFGEAYKQSKKNKFFINDVPDSETEETFNNQMARAMISFTPNSRNTLKLTLTESFNYDRQKLYEFNDMDIDNITPETMPYFTIRTQSNQINVRLNYDYLLGKSHKLSVSGNYTHSSTRAKTGELDDISTSNLTINNNAEGAISLTGNWKINDDKGSWGYKVGTRGATSSFNKQVQPQGELTFIYGPIRFKAAAEYQWNDDEINDWTGRMTLAWSINKNNRLRLLMHRQLRLPWLVSKEIGLDYLTDIRWDRHLLTMNGGVNYCKTKDIPEETSYINANLMAMYQHDIFFLSMTANYYRQQQNVEGFVGEKYKRYYNLSLMPSLNFKNGWRTALNLRYYSKVYRAKEEQGDCLSLQLNVGKTWGNISAYAYGRTPLTGRTRTIFYNNGLVIETDLVSTSVGCGVSWTF